MVKKIWFGLVILLVTGLSLQAQFDSGSTGDDGALSPKADIRLTCLEPECVFNYTTVNIPADVTVTFTPNSFNTGVTILASGDVTIAGTISVNGVDGLPRGSGGAGGPGGFRGGDGPRGSWSMAGLGPGGGQSTLGGGCGGSFATFGVCGGPLYGTPLLLPLIGGSGGSGGSFGGHGAGGGAGALLIASSTTITISGNLYARGGNGPNVSEANGGGGGSGGALRLIANAIGGNGLLSVLGGRNLITQGGVGGFGRIRLESGMPIPPSLRYEPASGEVTSVQIFPPGMPPLVVQASLPNLRIDAVDDVTVPYPPGGQFGRIDVNLTTTGTKPVRVAASGIPLGTTVQVTLKPEDGPEYGTVITGPLSGTIESSSATANVSFPRLGSYFLEARATFTVPTGGAEGSMRIGGEKIKQVRVETAYGTRSKVTYILESGKEVPGERMLRASKATPGR